MTSVSSTESEEPIRSRYCVSSVGKLQSVIQVRVNFVRDYKKSNGSSFKKSNLSFAEYNASWQNHDVRCSFVLDSANEEF